MTDRLPDRIATISGLIVVLSAVALGLLPPSLRPWTPISILPAATVLALIAGWRCRVHARAWIAQPGPAWQGVIEAAFLGPAITAIVLTPATIQRLLEAPEKVVPMMGDAALYAAPMIPIGLAAGLILRAMALLLLRRAAAHVSA